MKTLNNGFTKGQLEDLTTVEYFIPEVLQNIKITDEDRIMFCEWSERGKHKDKIVGQRLDSNTNGFNALVEGKKWRGIHIHEMYEEGVNEGTMPYYVILGGLEEKPMPRLVVDFLKREIFQGRYAKKIEDCYQFILNDTNSSAKPNSE